MKKLISLFHFATLELWNNKRFTLLFCAQLSLGLWSLGVVDVLERTVTETLASRAKTLLAADLAVGARRQLTPDEATRLKAAEPPGTKRMELTETFSMIAAPKNSRLVELKGIETEYPYYGEIELERGGVITGSSEKDLFLKPNVWMPGELLLQLNLAIGDTVKIGGREFTVSDVVVRDASSLGSGFSFAPPVYISRQQLLETSLVGVGSTGYFSILLKLPEGLTDTTNLVETLNRDLRDPAIQVTTPKKASEQIGRALTYLGDYLGLASLAALFLAAIGEVFLLRRYLLRRRAQVGILRAIGLKSSAVFQIYAIEVLLISLCAAAFSIIAALATIPAIKPLAESALDLKLELSFQWPTILLVTGLAVVSSLLVALPLLIAFARIPTAELFLHEYHNRSSRIQSFLLTLPAVSFSWLISVFTTKSFKVGTYFFIGFWASALLLVGLGSLFVFLVSRLRLQQTLFRMISRQLIRERPAVLATFLAVSLAVTLTSLLPQIRSGLLEELETPTGLNQPSLFLFDIQEDQVNDLKESVSKSGATVMQVSPMIRARLEKVNGQPFEKSSPNDQNFTREEENESRFRNRGFNLTYRAGITASERIVEGEPLTETQKVTLPEVSLEQRFASRLKLNIGDLLTFDIQGIPVEAKVRNLRKVRWTSFQPNFFIQFGPGILEDAPKTFLMTLAAMPNQTKADLQNRVVEKFPNVSILDVSRVVNRLSGILRQMTATLQILAIVTIFVGIFILFAVGQHAAFERRRDMALLKSLGVSYSRIRLLFVGEFAVISFFAAISGVVMSASLAYILGRELFEGAYKPAYFDWTMVTTAAVIVAIVVIRVAADRVLKRAVAQNLNSAQE